MGQVNVNVSGTNHVVGCQDGEEPHLRHLVSVVEGKVREVRKMGGQFSEARLMLHVALLLADELSDLRAEAARTRGAAPAVAVPAAAPPPPAEDPAVAERLARIAERIEGLAQTLDRP